MPSARATATPTGSAALGTQFAVAVEAAAAAAGFTPRIVHRADEAQLIEALVAAGLGVALLPALARTPHPGIRHCTATPAAPRRHVWALARRGATRRPALAAALHAIQAVTPPAVERLPGPVTTVEP